MSNFKILPNIWELLKVSNTKNVGFTLRFSHSHTQIVFTNSYRSWSAILMACEDVGEKKEKKKKNGKKPKQREERDGGEH